MNDECTVLKYLSGSVLLLELDSACYTREAITATLYSHSRECEASVITKEENWNVRLEFSGNLSKEDMEQIGKRFFQDLLDFQLRDDIARRTGKIRELIVEHAFAPVKKNDS